MLDKLRLFKRFTYEKSYDIIKVRKEVHMINLNISNARDELYKLASSCIKYNDVVTISTKEGNVILLSEDDYNSLIESLYLAGVKGVYEDIEEAVNTPTSEFSKEPPWK